MTVKARKLPKRTQLTADAIARTALALADAEGLDNFSYRNLAKKLGCEAMSIYHYYPSKAHLLDAMVALCLAELTFLPAHLPWQDRLRHGAAGWRTLALRHPGFFPFLAVYRLNSPEGLAMLDQVVSVFRAAGLSPEGQARGFRVFGYYITGAALDEAIGYAKGPSSANPLPDGVAAAKFPAITGIGTWFAREHHKSTFDLGVEMLVRGIEDLLAREANNKGGGPVATA